MAVEGVRKQQQYSLKPSRVSNEDILICLDIDPQCLIQMKGATGPKDRPLTQLDSVKQAIVLFVNAKLTINPQHRFTFITLSNTISWVRKDFTFDIDSTLVAMQSISTSSSAGPPDLTFLFQLVAHEAKKSRVQVASLELFCSTSDFLYHSNLVKQFVVSKVLSM
ncbi:hypothetical protein V8G54_003023 [Vigna mungo]|uniref:BRISC and BRCA1-A complex member 1 n=1 Tax=Vigna mungo TaxID=3915 RepID=A0AAQ3PBH2_VIGMU